MPARAEDDVDEIRGHDHHPEIARRSNCGCEARYANPHVTDLFRFADLGHRREEDVPNRRIERLQWPLHHVVGNRVSAELRGTQKATDEKVVSIAVKVGGQPGPENVAAKAGEASQALA